MGSNVEMITFEETLNNLVERGDFLTISHCYKGLSKGFIYKFGYCLAWGHITEMETLYEDEMEAFCGFWSKSAWMNACHYQKMSEKFMREHYNDLDWDLVCHYQNFSESFIDEFSSYVNWGCISAMKPFSIPFIERHIENIDWDYLRLDDLNENFIREYIDYIGFHNLPMKKQLSEDFMREFADELNWSEIKQYQTLSDSFKKEFANKLGA